MYIHVLTPAIFSWNKSRARASCCAGRNCARTERDARIRRGQAGWCATRRADRYWRCGGAGATQQGRRRLSNFVVEPASAPITVSVYLFSASIRVFDRWEIYKIPRPPTGKASFWITRADDLVFGYLGRRDGQVLLDVWAVTGATMNLFCSLKLGGNTINTYRNQSQFLRTVE